MREKMSQEESKRIDRFYGVAALVVLVGLYFACINA